jgi:hypothetical protein
MIIMSGNKFALLSESQDDSPAFNIASKTPVKSTHSKPPTYPAKTSYSKANPRTYSFSKETCAPRIVESSTKSDEDLHNDMTKDIKSHGDCHPLARTWSVTYSSFSEEQRTAFHSGAHKVVDPTLEGAVQMSTIEGYARTSNHLFYDNFVLLSGVTINVFERGTSPDWNEPRLENAGKWMLTFTADEYALATKAWINLMMHLVGETFINKSNDDVSDYHSVVGMILQHRKKLTKIQIYVENKDDKDVFNKLSSLLTSSYIGIIDIGFYKLKATYKDHPIYMVHA